MSTDPYRRAAELQERTEATAVRLGEVLGRNDALARRADCDELRQLVDELADAARGFEALLNWIDESDLPPGLRAALDRPGWQQVGADPRTGAAVTVGPNPIEAGEPLAALVHTAEMGEAYDTALLDLADLGVGVDYDPADAAHRHWPYRFRLRAIAEGLDAELGPLEHASLYLDAAGARRLGAMLLGRAAETERQG